MTVPAQRAAPREAVYAPAGPVDVRATLGPLVRGSGDPGHRVTEDGAFWRTCRTPLGPATLRLAARTGAVHAAAWGPGAEWVLDGLPVLLGADDDWSGLALDHPLLRDARARHPGLRLSRTRLVLDALAPAVIEQKVTGKEAFRAYRVLVQRHGEPAPGPAPAGMRVPPPAEVWRRVPSWEWHRAGVDGKRSRTVCTAAAVAARLEECCGLAPDTALARLQAVPGVGVWTAAEVAQRALGHPDAVSVGDYHLAAFVGWALVGRPVDDDGMLELLAPWEGHRHRVVRLLQVSGVRKPRFGPRMTVQDHRAH